MLEIKDCLMEELLEKEKKRQKEKLILNAAVSITPKAVLEIQSSVFDNIDAEGYIPTYLDEQSLEELSDIPHQLDHYQKYRDDRCNKCCEYANIVEALAKKRIARVFQSETVKEDEIYVNVQVPTGAIANFIVYEALLQKGDTILTMDLTDGGHITHGSSEHKTGREYHFIHYHIDMEQEDLDYAEIKEKLKQYQPAMLVAGASNYPLRIDFKKIKELIDAYSPKTLFMADIAHTAGLVAGKVFENPISSADVVTMVTYKTFLGPRSAVIMSKEKRIAQKIDDTVFPYFMGSPLLLNIAGVAVAAHLAQTEEYQRIQNLIVSNANQLTQKLKDLKVPVVFSKSESHIVLIDCNNYGNARQVADHFEDCGLLVNDCKVPSKNGAHEGIRIGTTWISQMGISDMRLIADMIKTALEAFSSRETNQIKEQVKKYLQDWEEKNENI